MKKQMLRSGIFAFLLLQLTGCYQLTAQVKSDKPVLMNSSKAYQSANKTPFVTHGNHVFLFWGLVGNDNDTIENHLQDRLRGHRALQRVQIQRENSVLDTIVGAVTLGIIVPRSFTLRGEAVE